MKFLKLLSIILVFSIFYACDKSEEEVQPVKQECNEFIRYNHVMTETFDSTGSTNESIDYTYEKEDDFFWVKAEYKDHNGIVFKTKFRELDKKSRLPIKETYKDELGDAAEWASLEYCPDYHVLLHKTEYEGEIKVAETIYEYENGYLMAYEKINYSKDSAFKNVDGNNTLTRIKYRSVIPVVNRYKGYHDMGMVPESYKRYFTQQMIEKMEMKDVKPGDLQMELKTEFNDENLPVTYTSVKAGPKDEHDDHHSDVEYYKVDNSGTVASLISIEGYEDPEFTKASMKNQKLAFEYDDNGMIASIKEYKYNDSTKAFDLMHDSQEFEWKKPEINSKYDFTEASVKNEHICYHRLVHSFNEQKILKYANGELIVAEFSAEFPKGEAPEKPELKKDKQTNYHFEIVKMKKKEKKMEEE